MVKIILSFCIQHLSFCVYNSVTRAQFCKNSKAKNLLLSYINPVLVIRRRKIAFPLFFTNHSKTIIFAFLILLDSSSVHSSDTHREHLCQVEVGLHNSVPRDWSKTMHILFNHWRSSNVFQWKSSYYFQTKNYTDIKSVTNSYH